MKTNKWFWGIFFICAAAAVILNALGYLADVSLFSIVFAVILIPVIVKSILGKHYAGIFFPLAFAGILFAKPLHIEALSPWPLLVAALFLSIAFSILFKRKKSSGFKYEKFYGGGHKNYSANVEYVADDGATFTEDIEYTDDNEVNCSVSFSACTKYIHCDSLKTATLSAACGALKVFLDNTRLDAAGAVINVDCSLGSIELYVPKAWRVENRITATLGSVDEKNKPSDFDYNAASPLLTLEGSTSLGSLVVVYV